MLLQTNDVRETREQKELDDKLARDKFTLDRKKLALDRDRLDLDSSCATLSCLFLSLIFKMFEKIALQRDWDREHQVCLISVR